MRPLLTRFRIGFVNGILALASASVLLILLFLALEVSRGFDQNAFLRREAAKSYAARTALQGVLTLHQDIELGQRGFVITGNPDFLEPYRNAEAQIDGKLDAFAKLAGCVGWGDASPSQTSQSVPVFPLLRRQRICRMRGFRHWRWQLDEMYVKLNGKMALPLARG